VYVIKSETMEVWGVGCPIILCFHIRIS